MMQPLGGWGAGRWLEKPLVGWLHWSRSLAAWLLWAGPWRAGWSLESWLHCWLVPGGLAALLAGPWRAGCAGLVPGGLAALLAGPWRAGYTAGPCLSKYVEDVFI